MAEVEGTPTSARDQPVNDVVIKDCGVLPLEKPFPLEY